MLTRNVMGPHAMIENPWGPRKWVGGGGREGRRLEGIVIRASFIILAFRFNVFFVNLYRFIKGIR